MSLERIDRKTLRLRPEEETRINNILKRAMDVEKGVMSDNSSVNPDHPDGCKSLHTTPKSTLYSSSLLLSTFHLLPIFYFVFPLQFLPSLYILFLFTYLLRFLPLFSFLKSTDYFYYIYLSLVVVDLVIIYRVYLLAFNLLCTLKKYIWSD